MESNDERLMTFLKVAAEFFEAGAERLPEETRLRVARLVGAREAELLLTVHVSTATATACLMAADGSIVELFRAVAKESPESMH
jgi:hypothetical protein